MTISNEEFERARMFLDEMDSYGMIYTGNGREIYLIQNALRVIGNQQKQIKELKKDNKILALESQGLFESINCNDDTCLSYRYKELKKELEELKIEININTEIHKRDLEIEDLKETIKCLHESDKEYISKDKIREKIKELEEDREKVRSLYQPSDDDSEFIHTYQILVLKELLEEGDNNE